MEILASEYVIEIKGVVKEYNGIRALDGVDAHIKDKCITCIIGPNGAGKSTFLKIAVGIEFPDSGTVTIKNRQIKVFKDAKRYVSFMPENMRLYPDFYVGEFLHFFHEVTDYKEAGFIEFLELKSVYNKKIKELSKGWHQRLRLYLALAPRKPITIMDEPFEGFDPLNMRRIEKLFRKEREERAFLLSIHQLNYAERVCDMFMLLYSGRMVAHGSIYELSKRFGKDKLEDIFISAIENEMHQIIY